MTIQHIKLLSIDLFLAFVQSCSHFGVTFSNQYTQNVSIARIPKVEWQNAVTDIHWLKSYPMRSIAANKQSKPSVSPIYIYLCRDRQRERENLMVSLLPDAEEFIIRTFVIFKIKQNRTKLRKTFIGKRKTKARFSREIKWNAYDKSDLIHRDANCCFVFIYFHQFQWIELRKIVSEMDAYSNSNETLQK